MLKALSAFRLSYLNSLKLTARRSYFSTECLYDESIMKFISENTEIVVDHNLTPEIKLRLFTPNCRFWFERPEFWPFEDPYWAIYWPGGQALSRYLLDNPGVSLGKSVLDLGCGCGASAIAAKLCGANQVVANDIDSVATLATCMNFKLNGLESPVCVIDDMIGSDPGNFDLILLGDMFYDEALSYNLHTWLEHCIKTHKSQVLIGDPGRGQFEELTFQPHLKKLAQFELPKSVREENYGLNYSSVWCYDLELTLK